MSETIKRIYDLAFAKLNEKDLEYVIRQAENEIDDLDFQGDVVRQVLRAAQNRLEVVVAENEKSRRKTTPRKSEKNEKRQPELLADRNVNGDGGDEGDAQHDGDRTGSELFPPAARPQLAKGTKLWALHKQLKGLPGVGPTAASSMVTLYRERALKILAEDPARVVRELKNKKFGARAAAAASEAAAKLLEEQDAGDATVSDDDREISEHPEAGDDAEISDQPAESEQPEDEEAWAGLD